MSKLVPPHGSDTINALALSGDALSAELQELNLCQKLLVLLEKKAML